MEEKYGFCSASIKLQPFRINTFWSLGLSDPFPDEATMIDKQCHMTGKERFNLDENVYNMRPINDFRLVYVPNRIVLFKMMRACIDCSSPDELWLN